MTSHPINLSSAWERAADAAGGVVWIRRFGRPAGLGGGDRVRLVFESARGEAACTLALNGRPLAAAGATGLCDVDVTDRLLERNELAIVAIAARDRDDDGLDAPAADGSPARRPLPERIGRVRLEIDPAPY